MKKPLSGIKVLDLSALGPGPFASRMLADYGAEVVTVEAPTDDFDIGRILGRGKKSLVLDLKAPGARDLVLDIVGYFDVLIESMRPGKMEKLGLGPDKIGKRAPRTIYVRSTAYGQTGPLSDKAGHDINVIAISGALSLCGIEQPLPPGTLLGDFASGSMMIVVGVLLALLERQRSGRGRVIDAAMCDGATLLVGGMLPLYNSGAWGVPGTNLVDGSRPFYTTYRCADGKWLAVGAIEPRFFAALVEGTGLQDVIDPRDQMNPEKMPFIREQLSGAFARRTRDEWVQVFEDKDACVSPVLEMSELLAHPHHQARGSIYSAADGVQAGVAPRMQGIECNGAMSSPIRGAHSLEVLRACGISESTLRAAIATRAVKTCN